jgi:hypothetical protein
VFVGDLNLDPFKPATVDSGLASPPLIAAVIDIALMALFGASTISSCSGRSRPRSMFADGRYRRHRARLVPRFRRPQI